MIKKFIPVVVIVMLLCFWHTNAEAARAFGIAQAPAIGSQFDMRSTQTINFTITNSNTAGSTDRIYSMRFRLNTGCGTLPCAASVFSNATAAPPNWTRTAWSTTSVTFRANSWAYAIPSTGTKTFPIVFTMGNMTVDTTVTLRDVRASFTTTGTFCYSGCAPLQNATTSGTVTLPAGAGGSCAVMTSGSTPAINTCVSWILKSLSLSFQITDLGGTPVTSIAAGNGFITKMTITNNSSVAQNGIVSSPNPPTATIVPTVTLNVPPAVYNPNPLNLAVGAAGTITYTYTTAAADAGTVYFTAFATRGGVATSSSQNSPILTIGQFVASITVNPQCAYNGQNITVTMQLTNKFPNNIINVTPILNPSVGAPVIFVAGPIPAAPNGPVPSGGGTFNFTWTYQIGAGTPGQTFTFTGSANGTQQPPGTPRAAPNSTSLTITRGGYTVLLNPATSFANSTNEELTWLFQNQGCAVTNIVSISGSAPAGWIWAGGDSYSLVGNSKLENWAVGGANPPVVFSAPTPADRLPTLESGSFTLVFPTTPTPAVIPTTYNFNVSITDAGAVPFTDIVPTTVTVNAFDSSLGGPNATGTGVWQETIH